jgi:amidohydrolase
MKEKIVQWVEDHRSSVENMYEHLHNHPELSWEEYETSTYLRKLLDHMGMPYRTFADHPRLVAEWKGSGEEAGRCIALRADMDALNLYKNGEWKAVHACGHDAHMTMVYHALASLRDIGFLPKGCLKVIFQPAEEGAGGSRRLSEQGVIDDIDCLLGIHLRPIQEMPDGFASSGIYHGCSGKMEAVVTGRAAHAAKPHLGVNAADVLLAVGLAVNSLRLDPSVPASAKMTIMRTEGESRNVIPAKGYCCIDMRAQTDEAMRELIDKLKRAIEGAGCSFGAEVEAKLRSCGSAAQPDEWMEQVIGGAIGELDSLTFHNPPVTPGAEDFHYYRQHKPQIRATMIGLGCDLAPGLHDPEMTFQSEAMLRGIELLALSTIRLFEGNNEIFNRF